MLKPSISQTKISATAKLWQWLSCSNISIDIIALVAVIIVLLL